MCASRTISRAGIVNLSEALRYSQFIRERPGHIGMVGFEPTSHNQNCVLSR